MAKANITTTNGSLVATFATGQVIEVNPSELSPDIQRRLMLHGLEQKIRDSYAGATAEGAYGLAMKVVESLRAGQWSQRGATSPSAGARGKKLLAMAVAELLRSEGKPVPEDLEERIEALSLSDRAKLRAEPRIAAIIARMKPPKGQDLLESIIG